MHKTRRLIAGVAVFLMLNFMLNGCAKPVVQAYLKPGLQAAQIRTIAVLPFDNTSGEPDAGMKVLNLLLTELTRTRLFVLADVGEVERILRELRVRTVRELDKARLHQLVVQLHVQAVLVGSVDEYQMRQDKRGSVPVVAIHMRMLDARTGQILWAASHIRDGNDQETVFGFGRILSLSRLAQIVISEMVDSLVQGLNRFPQTNQELGSIVE